MSRLTMIMIALVCASTARAQCFTIYCDSTSVYQDRTSVYQDRFSVYQDPSSIYQDRFSDRYIPRNDD